MNHLHQGVSFLFWAVVFGLVYTQAPLYYSNQNQYFLHGLAQGGLGYLDEDWLAGTRDPTPVFSALIAVTYRWLHESVFYLYYVLIFGIYFRGMVGIWDHLAGPGNTPLRRLGFIVLFLAVHSAILRWLFAQWLGVDYLWYFQAGLAGQYLLGPTFQPSVFGVLLVLSLWLFVSERPIAAGVVAAVAALCHSTYLLSAALLTMGYLVVLARERRWREGLVLAGLALALVTPVLWYNWMTFGPSSPESFAEAQRILVHFRIPHHAVPAKWFGPFGNIEGLDGHQVAVLTVGVLQVVWFVLALFLIRGERLFTVLLTASLSALALTAVQLVTDNNTLALVFPWRISALLVPVATTIILSRIVIATGSALERRGALRPVLGWIAGSLAVAGLALGGLAINVFALGYRITRAEDGMMTWVKDHAQPGQVYLIPVTLPRLDAAKLPPLSSDFRPETHYRRSRVIPFELQKFRLFTGVPILVDFKAIPYQDEEVLQWRRRLELAREFYAQLPSCPSAEVIARLRAYGVTHVVTVAEHDPHCDELEPLWANEHHRVWALSTERQTKSDGAGRN